jgi:hypothetical protein
VYQFGVAVDARSRFGNTSHKHRAFVIGHHRNPPMPHQRRGDVTHHFSHGMFMGTTVRRISTVLWDNLFDIMVAGA